MNIIQVASEAVPFSKTGGLADVVGALSKYFARQKHNVTLFLPLYKQTKESAGDLISAETEIKVPLGDQTHLGLLWKSKIPGTNATVFLIQHDEFFNRDNLYSTPAGDYPDNAERFIFFSRGVLEAITALKIKADIIHCHDWQTGLIPVYLKTLYRSKKDLQGIKTFFTVHNLAYQGLFKQSAMPLTGLDWSLFNWRQLEFYGKINLLKGGLVFADMLSTVSARYAQEIQTPEFGEGLHGVMQERDSNLYGIINGIDYAEWNPQTDRFIPEHYQPDRLAGKTKCKKLLQENQQLPVKSNVPVIGMVSRLVQQKGVDLLIDMFEPMMELGVQFVLLGTGEEKYHTALENLTQKYPDQFRLNITFDNRLAHLITAGADMLVLPSRYEPCGLNQIYALKYGTVPIVRETGGLADTIINFSEEGIKNKKSTGFSFKNYSAEEFLGAVKQACAVYRNKKTWQKLMEIGMSQDWSWDRSAAEYIKLYQKLLNR